MSFYYDGFVEAYLRSSLGDIVSDDLVLLAESHDLNISYFKRLDHLPRVVKTVGILKGFNPSNLLDLGSGRGAFLWSILHEMPLLNVTAVDVLDYRVEMINAVSRGGIGRVKAVVADASALEFQDNSFDAVTVLEVLEHVDNPELVASEAIRVSSDLVVASMPSKDDNNPEHVRLFTTESVSDLFIRAGASKVSVDYVPNHMIAVARK